MALQRLPITPVTVVDAAIVIIPDGIFTHTFPAKTISYPPITVHKPPQLASRSSFTPQFQAFSASSSNGDSEESSVQLSEPEPESEPELEPEPEPESNSGDAGGIEVEVEKVSKNRRRIRSKVAIDASLQTVWGILTDYERLADIIPSLVVSQVLDKGENFARLLQVCLDVDVVFSYVFGELVEIGQQNLAFGLKFSAKGVIDCYEQDFEVLPNGQRRDIDFKMIEGDFTIFEGKWSIEQVSSSLLLTNNYWQFMYISSIFSHFALALIYIYLILHIL
ncbi:putative coenzyme Q-binding protein COQ10, START [Helianthus annuus]|nr:putative coenzyme Q-binding protein COQ10, START [Helianthus annuus]